MTNEQIEQNAEEYARQFLEPYDEEYAPIKYVTAQMAHIAGAHSRDEEVEKLKLQLDKAVALLKDIFDEDDYFCTKLVDIPSEVEVCAKCCNNLTEECVLRFLKFYNSKE